MNDSLAHDSGGSTSKISVKRRTISVSIRVAGHGRLSDAETLFS